MRGSGKTKERNTSYLNGTNPAECQKLLFARADLMAANVWRKIIEYDQLIS